VLTTITVPSLERLSAVQETDVSEGVSLVSRVSTVFGWYRPGASTPFGSSAAFNLVNSAACASCVVAWCIDETFMRYGGYPRASGRSVNSSEERKARSSSHGTSRSKLMVVTQIRLRSVAIETDVCGSKPCLRRISDASRVTTTACEPVLGATGLHQSSPQRSR